MDVRECGGAGLEGWSERPESPAVSGGRQGSCRTACQGVCPADSLIPAGPFWTSGLQN